MPGDAVQDEREATQAATSRVEPAADAAATRRTRRGPPPFDGRARHQRVPPNEKRRAPGGGRRAAQPHDGRRRVHARRARLAALPGEVAAPGGLVVVHQAHDRPGIQSARLLDDAPRRGERGRPDVARVAAGDGAGRQADPALDAVLVALERLDPLRGLRTRDLLGGAHERAARVVEIIVEDVHVDHQVGHDGEVPERLDRHVRAGGDGRHAGEALPAVDPHPAGAARCVEARVAEGEARVQLAADRHERVEDRGPGPHGHVVGVVPQLVRVVALLAARDDEAGGTELGRAVGHRSAPRPRSTRCAGGSRPPGSGRARRPRPSGR